MEQLICRLKRQYFDWRYWDYLYRNMKKKSKTNTRKELVIQNLSFVKKPGITFSIDDSFRVQDWYAYGKNLFGFYDVRVTFNINAFHHYEDNRELSQAEIDMLIELQSYGHEIAHHGYNHKDAVKYTEQMGVKKWIEDDIESLFKWMEEKSHSVTGEKFKRPVTFAYPHFRFNEETLKELVPKYFMIARGHLMGNYLTPLNYSGLAPSICIDSHYLYNPRNVKRILKYVNKLGSNLILTCHSILPNEVEWESFGWEMENHAKRWRTSPQNIQYIITEAKRIGFEFYTTAELSGVATFIDHNFENYIKKQLSKHSNDNVLISELLTIKELDLSNKNIINLDGIQYFKGLEMLNLQNTNITDFRLLEKLPNIKKVLY
ncbi:DUF2334 domain-containing protein [Fredinandcohnia humi]